MFASFNYGDPVPAVSADLANAIERDLVRIGDTYPVDIVGRLSGRGSWVDDDGTRYWEESGSVQVWSDVDDVAAAALVQAFRETADRVAREHGQDGVAVVIGGGPLAYLGGVFGPGAGVA